MSEPVFDATDVTKIFPGVRALDEVAMTLRKGSIHALLGENGAGKSTLIKIMTGVYRPESGRMTFAGRSYEPHSIRDAIERGIGVVHQERNLIPRFSIAENIFLEDLSAHPLRRVDYSSLYNAARRWLDMLEIDADPSLPVERLSVAKMQLVEIAKALSLDSQVLLLDEPTASLTAHETDTLFQILRRLRDDDVSIIFVSHKLEEVQHICDQVTVLRDGRNACQSRPLRGLDRQGIVRLMIGRTEQIPNWETRDRTGHSPALELKGVATEVGHADVNLTIRSGEIVGLYGLVGAGRSELAKAILGKFKITAGDVFVHGKSVNINSIAEAVGRYRIGYVSEDRKNEGLILIHSVLDNVGMSVWKRIAIMGSFLTKRRIRSHTAPYIRKLEVRTPSLDQHVGNLSGGNQQKVSVAKWLAAEVHILVVDEPSVGIDIKTKAYLHELIRELSDAGTALLLITSDMPEMIALADRIVVMSDNRIKGELVNTRQYAEISEQIMNLIQSETLAMATERSE